MKIWWRWRRYAVSGRPRLKSSQQQVPSRAPRTTQLAHLDLAAWLRDLRHDKQQLDLLLSSAHGVTVQHDAKLHELRELIREKVTKPPSDKLGRPNRKVLVFTAFADTAICMMRCARGRAMSWVSILHW
ncbi:MAG: hypothetical protein ACJ8CR_05300 [Roseiflexaceae bacterium]